MNSNLQENNMTLSEKAAYIKGLCEGLELDESKKETRVIKELLQLVCEMANDVDDIGEDMGELYNAVEQIDEDLSLLEDDFYGEEDDDYDREIYEITCPNCEQVVSLSEDMLLSGNVVCPSCGEKFEIELDECGCECGCEHEHNHE
jgi:uncharacterized protein YbaR (Trm112 family)